MNAQMKLILSGALALSIQSIGVFAQEEDSTDFDQVSKEAKELLSALGDYGASQRDEAMEATERTLDKLDRSIEEMEHSMREQWDSMDVAAREQASI